MDHWTIGVLYILFVDMGSAKVWFSRSIHSKSRRCYASIFLEEGLSHFYLSMGAVSFLSCFPLRICILRGFLRLMRATCQMEYDRRCCPSSTETNHGKKTFMVVDVKW